MQPIYRIPNGGTSANALATGHYGSPVITGRNTVVLPVKVTSDGSFRIEARSAIDGALKWQSASDWRPPDKKLSFSAALTPSGRVYFPGLGGRLLYRDDADGTPGPLQSVAFYGNAAYDANKATFDDAIAINTPLTIDSTGNVYFGFQVMTSDSPIGTSGGIARIDPAGNASFTTAQAATGDPRMVKVQTGAAPAVSLDGKTLYAAFNSAPSETGLSLVYLVALDSNSLATRNKVLLADPKSGNPAASTDTGSTSPAVGTDGDVYFGVVGEIGSPHQTQGWLMHFDATLAVQKTPGAFGWDFTPSFVPTSAVGGYAGTSSYLLVSKYNEYATGQHRMAILDPNASQADAREPGVKVMKEVITVLSPNRVDPASAALHEWCINTAAVDPATRSVFMNNSDGFLYRWNLADNTLAEKFNLNSGYFQSYTPTALGPDGKVYAINNAVLMAVGR